MCKFHHAAHKTIKGHFHTHAFKLVKQSRKLPELDFGGAAYFGGGIRSSQRFKHTYIVDGRKAFQPLHRRVSNPATRRVDNPEQRLVVAFVVQNPKVSGGILYFLSFKELEASENLERYAVFQKLLFKNTA